MIVSVRSKHEAELGSMKIIDVQCSHRGRGHDLPVTRFIPLGPIREAMTRITHKIRKGHYQK